MGKQARSTKPGRLNVGFTSPARNTLALPGMNGSILAPDRFVVVERIKVGPALDRSRVTTLHGRPFPVQFRNQGAFEAWKQALGTGEEWIHWAHPKTTCWEIRQEILWQLNNIRVYRSGSNAPDEQEQSNARMQAVSISANLRYELQNGTIIEVTPALETLLANSDVDLDLPMNMVVPPYCAQYLRFGALAAQHLNVPNSDLPDRIFDGVFCFFTPPSERTAGGPNMCSLELIFINKRQDRFNGHVALRGETPRDNQSLGDWLDGVLDNFPGQSIDAYYKPMHAAVSYVVKVFLYMALRQARTIVRGDYDEAQKRIGGLGVKKRARLLQRMASLYNGILVGPGNLPPAPTASAGGNAVAPHWRRGHSGCSHTGRANSNAKSSSLHLF
jgi:hypothetical protein